MLAFLLNIRYSFVMKLSKQYEISLNTEGPQLVDVTSLGKGEGFNNSNQLRYAIVMALGNIPENVEALIKRLEANKLKKDDVVMY